MTPVPLAAGGRKGGSKRAKVYPFLESDYPPHRRVPTLALDRASPPYRSTPGSPSISPSFRLPLQFPCRLSDRAPVRSRVAPPRTASPQPTRPPPAGAKVFSPRRRKDAGPGLPGSSRAYLQGGRGLGLQPGGWSEPQRGRRGRKEARVRSTDQREKAA